MEGKEPHSVSLKVLRLSRPQLATQHPLPPSSTSGIDPRAALALPGASIDDAFVLSPVLTLPSTFGSAYVGESFSCLVSANNELPSSGSDKRITSLKLSAEMQTPSAVRQLELKGASASSPPTTGGESRIREDVEDQTDPVRNGLPQGSSTSGILHFDLREEGSHTLCVAVSYTEAVVSRSSAPTTNLSTTSTTTTTTTPSNTTTNTTAAVTSARLRSFRKLYNFTVGPCLSVRTKATSLPPLSRSDAPSQASSGITAAGPEAERFALECQLENLADDIISVEKLVFEAKPPFGSRSIDFAPLPPPSTSQSSINGHSDLRSNSTSTPRLAPREVHQVAFLLEEDIASSAKKESSRDGRTLLGVLTIHWRSGMGLLGVLSTGWLGSRRRL